MSLREFFDRAAIIARREGLPFTARDKSLTVQVDKVRHYLMLDGDNLKRKLHYTYRIETGLRADLVRVHREEGVPVTRAVWREGRRVI